MKLSRKLVPAIAMLLVSAVMLSTASFAWFSMNTTVTANNLTVKAQAMGSLVITKGTAPQATTNTDDVTFDAITFALTDAMRDAAQFAEGGTYTTGLKTIPSDLRNQVNIDNGSYNYDGDDADSDPDYEAVPVYASGAHYYVDYPVYIASKSDVLSGKKLNVSLSAATGDPAYKDAVTVDFYVSTNVPNASEAPVATAGTYKATAKVGTAAPVTLLTTDIPLAGTAYVYVIMRVYIDGNDSLVKNTNWADGLVTFNATFTIE